MSPHRLRPDPSRRVADWPHGGVDRGRAEGGAALIEFALALPFLVLFVFGVIDYGRAYSTESTLTNMAREGAAYLAFNPTSVSGCSTTGDATSSAQGEAPSQSASIVVTDVTTNQVLSGCPASPAPSAGDTIKVVASTTFTTVTPVGAMFTGSSTRTLTGSATAVVQG